MAMAEVINNCLEQSFGPGQEKVVGCGKRCVQKKTCVTTLSCSSNIADRGLHRCQRLQVVHVDRHAGAIPKYSRHVHYATNHCCPPPGLANMTNS